MIGKFQMQLVELEENIKSLILEKMKAPQRTGYIEEIINDCENQMVTIKENIEKLKTSDSIGKNAKLNIKSSVEILEQIIDEKSIDNAHLHMVLSNVSISQPDSENVNLEFELKTPLKAHVDMHDHIIKEIAMAATDKNKINGLKAS
jgi:hypothetical protein